MDNDSAHHGRSHETESPTILEEAVLPETRLKVGSELAAFGRRFEDIDLDPSREQAPATPDA